MEGGEVQQDQEEWKPATEITGRVHTPLLKNREPSMIKEDTLESASTVSDFGSEQHSDDDERSEYLSVAECVPRGQQRPDGRGRRGRAGGARERGDDRGDQGGYRERDELRGGTDSCSFAYNQL